MSDTNYFSLTPTKFEEIVDTMVELIRMSTRDDNQRLPITAKRQRVLASAYGVGSDSLFSVSTPLYSGSGIETIALRGAVFYNTHINCGSDWLRRALVGPWWDLFAQWCERQMAARNKAKVEKWMADLARKQQHVRSRNELRDRLKSMVAAESPPNDDAKNTLKKRLAELGAGAAVQHENLTLKKFCFCGLCNYCTVYGTSEFLWGLYWGQNNPGYLGELPTMVYHPSVDNLGKITHPDPDVEMQVAQIAARMTARQTVQAAQATPYPTGQSGYAYSSNQSSRRSAGMQRLNDLRRAREHRDAVQDARSHSADCTCNVCY